MNIEPAIKNALLFSSGETPKLRFKKSEGKAFLSERHDIVCYRCGAIFSYKKSHYTGERKKLCFDCLFQR